jgi:hypothetical protein
LVHDFKNFYDYKDNLGIKPVVQYFMEKSKKNNVEFIKHQKKFVFHPKKHA